LLKVALNTIKQTNYLQCWEVLLPIEYKHISFM
jgi:hypothetical protein